MSIDKLIAQNAAQARDLWLDSLPESIEFEASATVRPTKPAFPFRRKAKVLAALCLCLAFSFVALADEEPNHIDITYKTLHDGYKISIESNFEIKLPWKSVSFGYLPQGYAQTDESSSEFERFFAFKEIKDVPNSYTDRYYSITVTKLDKELRSYGGTHYTTWLLPEESHMDIGGNSSLILTLGITTAIYMPNDNYVITIEGTLPKDEMIKIAENVTLTGDSQSPTEPEEDKGADISPFVMAYFKSPVIRLSVVYMALCLTVFLALALHRRGKIRRGRR